MATIIPIPENFISSITSYMGQIFTDLAPYLALIIGVILGTLVITILISALRR